MHIDDDPCLNSIVTESILPLIPDRTINNSGTLGGSGFEFGACSNDSGATGGEGVGPKGRSGVNHGISTGSNSRNAVKGNEGTQVSTFMTKNSIKLFQ